MLTVDCDEPMMGLDVKGRLASVACRAVVVVVDEVGTAVAAR